MEASRFTRVHIWAKNSLTLPTSLEVLYYLYVYWIYNFHFLMPVADPITWFYLAFLQFQFRMKFVNLNFVLEDAFYAQGSFWTLKKIKNFYPIIFDTVSWKIKFIKIWQFSRKFSFNPGWKYFFTVFPKLKRAVATRAVSVAEEEICGILAHRCPSGCSMLFDDVLDSYYFGFRLEANFSRQKISKVLEFQLLKFLFKKFPAIKI